MGNAVDAVESSFKSLVAEKAYRSISVKEICDRAFISRRTFYDNFIHKRALVAYLFNNDAVAPVRRIVELMPAEEGLAIAPSIIERFYEGIYGEASYYHDLVRRMVGNDSTFELVAAYAVNKLIIDAVSHACPAVDADKLTLMAYYHASAQAILLEKWANDSFKTPVGHMVELQMGTSVISLARLAGMEL